MSTISRPFTSRAIHLKITPRPSNLGESREILRLLSGFGEIEYYKNLKYDILTAPNAALVIFREESAAREALKRSPIRFRMGRALPRPEKTSQPDPQEKPEEDNYRSRSPAPKGPAGTPFGLGGPPPGARAMSTTPTLSSDRYTTAPSDSRGSRVPIVAADMDPAARIFQITTNPSRRNYRDHINTSAFHGSFAIDSKQFGQPDMEKRVPIPGLSLMDWKVLGAEGRPWRLVDKERAVDHEGPITRKPLGVLWEMGRGRGWKKEEEDGKIRVEEGAQVDDVDQWARSVSTREKSQFEQPARYHDMSVVREEGSQDVFGSYKPSG